MKKKKNSYRKSTIKQGILALVIGIISLAVGIYGHLEGQKKDANCTETASATIVDWDEQSEMQGKIYVDVYYPVITYEANGQTYQNEAEQKYEEKKWDVGASIEIRYNPSNPESYIINDGSAYTNGFFIMIPIGVIIILLGFFNIINNIRRRV